MIRTYSHNATCPPESFQNGLTNIKFLFLPRNTTSRLQPLDAGIIRNFKLMHRKLLLRFIDSRFNDSKIASQIIEEVHILRAISWLQTAWNSVTPEIIKNCFQRCGFDVENNCEVINNQTDAEFRELFDQLSSETDIDEYIDFDIKVVTYLPASDLLIVDWRQETRNKSILEVMETSDAAAKEANQSEEEP